MCVCGCIMMCDCMKGLWGCGQVCSVTANYPYCVSFALPGVCGACTGTARVVAVNDVVLLGSTLSRPVCMGGCLLLGDCLWVR